MTLMRAADLRLTYGSRTIFEGLTLVIEEGERVGLVGVNGSGKSSLMQILARQASADAGDIQLRRGARVTYLPQEPEFPEGATVAAVLEVAQAPLREAIAAHQRLSDRIARHDVADEARALDEMTVLADKIERLGGWDTGHEARRLLDRLGVKEWDAPVSNLSGGQRKRVAIARALLERPDLLLLDEPTNHLDATTVEWLEEELDAFPGALLLVTHDRYFLDDLVDRIVEIHPGAGITSYPGNYEAYLEQKIVEEERGAVAEHKRQRWISQEVAWLRKGVEARRTKSKSRIERARALLAEKGFERPKIAAMAAVDAPRLGHQVLACEGIRYQIGGRTILDGVDFQLLRGERVGICGPNGVGKTTLLKILTGELTAQSGVVEKGDRTRIAWHDQHRTQLDPESTVYDAAWGEDVVELGGKRIFLRDYLDDLLFPVPMQRMKVGALSGGERNRLALARLFLQGANVLILDEPTNDLDIVTLNVLEGLLTRFTGSVLLVTHDRYFLDKVASSILAFDTPGKAIRWPGGFSSYRHLKAQADAQQAATKIETAPSRPTPVASTPAPAAKSGTRLSYREQKELDGMEAAIEAAEARVAALDAQLSDPAMYSARAKEVPQLQATRDAAQTEAERLYVRWEELLQKKG